MPLIQRRLGLGGEASTFLTAEWRFLVMLNYVADPAVLHPFVPRGTELGFLGDRTFVSVVGFRFTNTRIFGHSFPLHRDFEEVNLRFYVRRKTADGWRRGVVFIRELVPRRAIAFIARAFYGEPYSAFPMRHSVDLSNSGIRAEYGWRRSGRWETLIATGIGEPRPVESGSTEEFITEHYWGYTARGARSSEYEVEHPPWRVWPAIDASLDADVSTLYGERFVESLSAQPASSFIADGSAVAVRFNSALG